MSQRADIMNRIAKASSLPEQAALVAELDAFDRRQAQASRQDGEIDLTDTIVRQTLSPVAVHERSTVATDWLGEVTASSDQKGAQRIMVEASMWYRRLSPEVIADAEEFTEQARGMARRTASQYGDQAEGLAQEFLQYVAFLRTQAASGLPQVQQRVDSFENPAPTALPEQVFDNFAPPVDPINQGVSGSESSERAPLMQMIEGEGQGANQAEVPNHHDTAPQPYTYAEVPPAPAEQMQGRTSALYQPTVAINHAMTLDDFRREAASGLDQVQQIVDSFEDPDPKELPTEVAFPWEIGPDASGQANGTPPQEPSVNAEVVRRREQQLQQQRTEAIRRRAAYVAELAQRDPRSLTPTERQEVMAFTAALQKRADQWSQSGPQSHGPGPANSPFTTPEGTSGTFAEGYSEGRSDWNNDEAPTFADASPTLPDFVQGHVQGYEDAAHANPNPGGLQPDLPRGAGNPNPETHAASRKTAAATVTCAGCGTEDKPWNMTIRGNGQSQTALCRNCSPVTRDRYNQDMPKRGSLRVSASFTSRVEQADPEFAKGYKYAAKWRPGTPLVTTGSASFEAGLYAGISDNAGAQGDWVRLHRESARRYSKPEFLKRLSLHRSFTKKASRSLEGMKVVGHYLQAEQPVEKTAATSDDLDTMGPNTSPSPTGQTPINGPGQPGPLAGGTDPAAAGGPSPYNGAPPYGTPAVPNATQAHGTPTAISTTPGSAVDQAAMEHLSPQTLAFRKTVQASLLNESRQGK